MGLETGTNVGDLNPANPPGGDPKSMGDDHLRLIKQCLRDSFAGFTGAILVTGVDGGTINSYTLTPITPVPAMGPKMLVMFAPSVTNSGASTMNISGLGAVPLTALDGAALLSGDLVAGRLYAARYDGVNLRLMSLTKRYVDNLVISANFPPPPIDGREYILEGFNGSAAYAQPPVGAVMQAYNLGAL